ncbi:MAG: hypothetical protein ACUVWX_10770, partial [Kiritimatiellia bacterium]
MALALPMSVSTIVSAVNKALKIAWQFHPINLHNGANYQTLQVARLVEGRHSLGPKTATFKVVGGPKPAV